MRPYCWIAAIFVVVHGAGGDFVASYEGEKKAAVTALVQQTYNAPFDFITETQFRNFVNAHQPVGDSPQRILDKLQARYDVRTSTLTVAQRLQALLLLLDLDR